MLYHVYMHIECLCLCFYACKAQCIQYVFHDLLTVATLHLEDAFFFSLHTKFCNAHIVTYIHSTFTCRFDCACHL
jgi:hypothetical protein